MKIRHNVWFTISCALVFLLSTPIFAFAGNELKLGVLGPLSGPVAFAGKTVENAVNLAVDEINAAGGITVAGKTYKVKVVSLDTKYSSSVAKTAAERMIFEDKVKYIIGALSLDTKGFQAISEKNQVIVMPFGGGILPSPKTPYTFRASTLVDAKYVAIYSYIKKEKPELKKLVVINPDTPVGEAYENMSKSAAEPLGFEIVASEKIATGSSDFSPVITKLLSKKPDIIDLGGTGGGSDSALIIKQARELGYTGQIVCAVGIQSKAVSEVAGPDAMEGVMETGFIPTDPMISDGFRKCAEKYQAKFKGLPFIDLTAEAYDITYGFLSFLDSQDTLDPSVLRDRLSEYKWNGIWGESSFGGEKTFGIKNQLVHPAYISRWKDGKPAIIAVAPAPVP